MIPNTIDVKRIIDMPLIEDMLSFKFKLDLYEVGDRTIIYKSFDLPKYTIIIDMISDESLILGEMELADILTHYEIGFFQLTTLNSDDVRHSSYAYRPHIPESEKNYTP